jgi:hypothetical protein
MGSWPPHFFGQERPSQPLRRELAAELLACEPVIERVVSTLMFFDQEILPGSRTGKVKFQGGQVMMILEGKGHTMLDGVKHPWEAGDLVNLPLRQRGIVVQHFNDDPVNPVKFVAAEPNFFACAGVDRGSGFEQLEDAPEYRA